MDTSDSRPERWWVLNPEAHHLTSCGMCGQALPTGVSIPMVEDYPVCAYHAGVQLTGTPMTAEYARWMEEGDPRWWSAWLCNCPYCDAQEVLA